MTLSLYLTVAGHSSYAPKSAQYCSVLQSTTKHYSSATLYYKVLQLLQYYSLLQITTPLLQLLQYYNYSSTTP